MASLDLDTVDAHVDSEMRRSVPHGWVDSLETHEIQGNHWVVEQAPDLIAHHVADFVTRLLSEATSTVGA
jgi:hypothetical protein